MGRKGKRMEGEEEGSKGETIPNSPAPQYCRGPSWLGAASCCPNSALSLMNVTLHAYKHCLCLCWRFYSLEASQYLLLAPPTSSHTHTHTCVSLHIQIYSIYINIKSLFRNAPSSPVVKNLPINAEDMSSIPGPEDSTCLVSLLVKPESPRGHALRQEKPPQWEACALQLESSPYSPQLKKSPSAAPKTRCSQK